MCGVIGAVVAAAEGAAAVEVVRRGLAGMVRRGPDDEGLLGADCGSRRVILGHRRLSILDLSPSGAQPMRSGERADAGDHDTAITYNGEVYNFRKLRERLAARGCSFRSGTDTEVILRGYEEHGVEFVRELRGIFALAIHDRRRGKLVLARDRTGVKPLFVHRDRDAFHFASESKFLLPFLRSVELDPPALSYYLRLGYTPPGRSLFRGISKLAPGTVLEVDVDSLDSRVTRFYRLPRERVENGAVDAGALRSEVESIVEEQMIADVPVGTFLSGGLDSTIVTMVASRLNPDLTAFTTRFHTSDRYLKFNLDFEMAALAARRFGIRLEVVDIDESDAGLLDHFTRALEALDEPHANLTTFSTAMIARRAREIGFKVLLSGDGADEVFGGYDRYRKARLLERSWPLCLAHPKAASFFRGSPFDRYVRWHDLFPRGALAEVTPARPGSLDSFALGDAPRGLADMVNYYDLDYWLGEESNTRIDRACMMHSIEARVPFQDHRLIDRYWPVPLHRKLAGRDTKIPLKRAFDDLPREILERRKSGWNSPDSKWFRTFLRPYLTDLLSESKLRRQGIFDATAVSRLVERHLAGEYFRNQLRTLVAFQAWYDTHVDRSAVPAGV